LLVGSTSSIGSCNAQFNDAGGQSALFNSSSASGSYVGWFNSGAAKGYIGAAAQLTGGSANDFTIRGENNLIFATSSFERARIDSSGNLLVGKTTTAYSAGGTVVGIGNISISKSAETFSSYVSPSNAHNVFYRVDTGTYMGAIFNQASLGVSYTTASDYRLKENIQPMTGALETVAQLKPVTYKWKSDGSSGQGFIAHELQSVVPDAVVGEKDAVDADGSPKYQGIDTSFLVATLTAAIQELNAKFEEYKSTHP
jgi:hypothetical protein